MRKVVGFSQRTKKSWLDAMLDHLGREPDPRELKSFLDQALKEDLPSAASRKKSSGILMRVWSKVPAEHASLRDRAIRFLPTISGSEWIWLHWGMAVLAYPFFRDSAEIVGRILALQDDFTTSQVRDRMLNTWGDRATTREATQKLLNTLCDWEVLRPANTQGHFLLANKNKTASTALQLWLLEALLNASESSEIEAQQLLRLPEAFPFSITVGVADLRKSEYFTIHRQGLDMDMVGLNRRVLSPPINANPESEKQNKSFKPKAESNKESNSPQKRHSKPRRDVEKTRIRTIVQSLKKNDADTLSERTARFSEFYQAYERENGPFDPLIRQCIELYRDGYFQLCRNHALAVIDQVVQPRRKLKPHKLTAVAFEKLVSILVDKRLIRVSLKEKLVTARSKLHEVLEESLKPENSSDTAAKGVLELLVELDSALRADTLFD